MKKINLNSKKIRIDVNSKKDLIYALWLKNVSARTVKKWLRKYDRWLHEALKFSVNNANKLEKNET